MSNDTLLREVDEELRSERMRKFWRQGAPFIQKPWAPEQLLRRVREVLDSEVPAPQKA